MKEYERRYAKKKLGYKYDFIDTKARNLFNSNEVTPSIIKYAHRFNHFGLRDSMINNNMVEAYCLRCDNIETWDHVIKCKETIKLRKEFIEKLLVELLKQRADGVDMNVIIAFYENILRYLEEEEEEEYKTNQNYVGMKELF